MREVKAMKTIGVLAVISATTVIAAAALASPSPNLRELGGRSMASKEPPPPSKPDLSFSTSGGGFVVRESFPDALEDAQRYRSEAERGDPESQYRLALLYLRGNAGAGIGQDLAGATQVLGPI